VSKPTFADAALAYIQAGGERAYLRPIIEMTGPEAIRKMPLTDIDQIALDRAAVALYPNASAPTRNRQFYTPVSAVLKRAGIDKRILRPKGWHEHDQSSRAASAHSVCKLFTDCKLLTDRREPLIPALQRSVAYFRMKQEENRSGISPLDAAIGQRLCAHRLPSATTRTRAARRGSSQ
jgi:hypothetical protein